MLKSVGLKDVSENVRKPKDRMRTLLWCKVCEGTLYLLLHSSDPIWPNACPVEPWSLCFSSPGLRGAVWCCWAAQGTVQAGWRYVCVCCLLRQAAEAVGRAQQAESQCLWSQAFSHYQDGIGVLINGVQGASNHNFSRSCCVQLNTYRRFNGTPHLPWKYKIWYFIFGSGLWHLHFNNFVGFPKKDRWTMKGEPYVHGVLWIVVEDYGRN